MIRSRANSTDITCVLVAKNLTTSPHFFEPKDYGYTRSPPVNNAQCEFEHYQMPNWDTK